MTLVSSYIAGIPFEMNIATSSWLSTESFYQAKIEKMHIRIGGDDWAPDELSDAKKQ